MLFVTLWSLKPNAPPPAQRVQRRTEMKQPEGIKPIAEYWLQTNSPRVISISEANDVASIYTATLPWLDAFDITVVPALTAEEGLKIVSQIVPKT